jgi:hypothetical protein
LENEVAGMKEELARMGRQRDEAREECAKLMGEVEQNAQDGGDGPGNEREI